MDSLPKLPDLILFETLTAMLAAHTLLLSVGTEQYLQTLFYLVLLLLNVMCLVLLEVFMKGRDWRFFNYLQNLNQEAVLWIMIGVLGVYVSAVLIQNLVSSAIYIPKVVSLAISGVTLGHVASIFLYNVCLVANAEETTKLVAHQTIYLYLHDRLPEKWLNSKLDEGISVTLPIGFWATLHAYVAYVGNIMPQLVVSAFIGGLIIFAVMWKTKSLVAAILVHGIYNTAVLLAISFGWVMAILPIFLIPIACLNLILLVAKCYHATK